MFADDVDRARFPLSTRIWGILNGSLILAMIVAGLVSPRTFPFTAPFVMPVRWSMAAVPLPELALSLVIMVAALLGVVWIAGRIYRTGILMYGKKPTLREVFRWVRAG